MFNTTLSFQFAKATSYIQPHFFLNQLFQLLAPINAKLSSSPAQQAKIRQDEFHSFPHV